MARWGMLIDLDLCTGCNACTIACRQENNIPFVGKEEMDMGRAIRWMELSPLHEEDAPIAHRVGALIPRNCNHCENPPCIRVCPVSATFKNEEGIVGQIYYRCIGCRYCTVACPYTVRYFNWHAYADRVPKSLQKDRNPDVTVRMMGVVEKCSYCYQRIREAKRIARLEKRKLQDGDVKTACQQTCPAKAIYFGDLDDPNSEVSKRSRTPRLFRLLEDLGTEPKTRYLIEMTEDLLHE